MAYGDNLLQYDPIHRNIDIVDLFGVVASPLPIMVHNDVYCQFPLVLEYFSETHYMTPMKKVLLQLRRRWALILSLAFVIDVPNVVRKAGYCIVPLDRLLL